MQSVAVAEKLGVGIVAAIAVGEDTQRGPARGRACGDSLVEQDDLRALPREEIGRRAADDTGPDHQHARARKGHLTTDDRRQVGRRAGARAVHRIAHIREDAVDLSL